MFNGTVSHIVLSDFIEFESGFFMSYQKRWLRRKGLNWLKETKQSQMSSSQGCGYLFLLFLLLIIPLGGASVKALDNALNNPKKQLLSQLPDFVEVPSYDRKDDSPKVSEIKNALENETWYEIRIHGTNQKEYIYLVKVSVRNKLFLQPAIKVTEVVER